MKSTVEYLNLLKDFKERESEHYGIKEIGIFGSVARGEQHEGSDVDVFVNMVNPNVFTLVHIKDDLELLLGVPVDLVRIRERLNPLLKKNIERDGIYA